ncbi:hypothetical protein ABH912_004227 [Pseudomonas sp. BT76 TE3572]
MRSLVAAAEGCVRLRSSRKSDTAVCLKERGCRICDGFAAERCLAVLVSCYKGGHVA